LASKDIPDGYFWFHLGLGGLDLKSSFVPLVVIRDKIIRDPQELMQKYLKVERQGYEVAKKNSEEGRFPADLLLHHLRRTLRPKLSSLFPNMSKYREQTSVELLYTHEKLNAEPKESSFMPTENFRHYHDKWSQLTNYDKWNIQLFGDETAEKSGSLQLVERGLLTGMVEMFRESRFKWQNYE
jgi:hypothetical protein